MYNKTIIRFGFCDFQNNQGLGKGQSQPSASADNPYLDLDYSGYHKNLIQYNSLIFGINTTRSISKLLYVISGAVRRVKLETIYNITYIEITSWLVSAYDFSSQQVNKNSTSEPTMMLFVYFISTEISFKQ